ncbi:MAG: hypothetical protein V3T55_11080, partial [Anaerolineales bacterium]
SPRFHDCLYSITRSHSLQIRPVFVGRSNLQIAFPAFGRSAFIPTAHRPGVSPPSVPGVEGSDGVFSRSLS